MRKQQIRHLAVLESKQARITHELALLTHRNTERYMLKIEMLKLDLEMIKCELLNINYREVKFS